MMSADRQEMSLDTRGQKWGWWEICWYFSSKAEIDQSGWHTPMMIRVVIKGVWKSEACLLSSISIQTLCSCFGATFYAFPLWYPVLMHWQDQLKTRRDYVLTSLSKESFSLSWYKSTMRTHSSRIPFLDFLVSVFCAFMPVGQTISRILLIFI